MRFKQLLIPFVLGAWLGAPTFAQADCERPFQDADDVLDLHIRVTQDEWTALIYDQQQGSGCDAQYPYHEVEFRCGDTDDWIVVGARHKRGDQRGFDTEQKPPIKLDFNRYVMGQSWPASMGKFGYRKLSMNQGQEDNPGGILTALLSEHLAWRLMRNEVPTAGGVAYARLWVHFEEDDSVEYHGLYILIEDIDRSALRRRWGDDDDQGTLLKTTTGSCRNQVVFDDGPPNQATDGFDAWMDLDPNDTYANGWTGETENALHLDELLRQEALRDILANRADTVLGNNHSNFLSWDSQIGKRHYLPWDLDDVFAPMPQDVNYNHSLEGSCSDVGDRTRCHDEIRGRYLEIMCQLINGTLEVNRLVEAWDHVDALIRPIIPDEVDLVWGGVDPLEDGPDNNYQAEYVRIRQWIQDRIPWVRGQLDNMGHACAVGCQPGDRESCDFVTCEGERVCEDGLWTGCQSIAMEVCDNGQDDDCDGDIDEDCPGGDGGTGDDGTTGDDGGTGGGSGDDGGGGDGGDGGADDGGTGSGAGGDGEGGGCGCATASSTRWPAYLLPLIAGFGRRRPRR